MLSNINYVYEIGYQGRGCDGTHSHLQHTGAGVVRSSSGAETFLRQYRGHHEKSLKVLIQSIIIKLNT